MDGTAIALASHFPRAEPCEGGGAGGAGGDAGAGAGSGWAFGSGRVGGCILEAGAGV